MLSTLSRQEIPAQKRGATPRGSTARRRRSQDSDLGTSLILFPPDLPTLKGDKERHGLLVAPGGQALESRVWCLPQAVSWSQEALWTALDQTLACDPGATPCAWQ